MVALQALQTKPTLRQVHVGTGAKHQRTENRLHASILRHVAPFRPTLDLLDGGIELLGTGRHGFSHRARSRPLRFRPPPTRLQATIHRNFVGQERFEFLGLLEQVAFPTGFKLRPHLLNRLAGLTYDGESRLVQAFGDLRMPIMGLL